MLIELLKNEITQDDYTRSKSISIVYKDLPEEIKGYCFTYKCRNIVVINNLLELQEKKSTLLHEFAHIELGHLNKDLIKTQIAGIEDEADKYVEYLEGLL